MLRGWKLDGWRDGHQQPQVGFGAQTMGFGDITDHDVPGFGRDCGIVFSQKLTFTLKNDQTQLPFDIMAVDGKFLAGLEVEIYNFKIR